MTKSLATKNFQVLLVSIVLLLTACGSMVHHKVERGETLYSIGWRYDQDYRDIARWNGLEPPYQIKPGQWLRVAPPEEAWWVDEYPDRVAISSKKNQLYKSQARATNRTRQTVIARETKTTPDEITDWRWPTTISSDKQIFHHNNRQKKGIDIAGQVGQTIYAAASGKVVYAGSGLVGYGKLIIIKHNRTYLSAYGHNQRLLVKEGERVEKGQMIAKMGLTDDGRSLLYFETRRNGRPVNPLSILPTLP